VAALVARPLTAEDAALLAVLGSPALQARYAELGIAAGGVARARTPANPELEAELLFPGDGDAHVELAALQDLTSLLTLLPRAKAADAELRAARGLAIADTVALVARAKIGFYQVAAAEEILARRRVIAEAAAASALLAKSLHDAGNLTDLVLAREQAFEEETALDVADAEAAVLAARERMNALLGLGAGETGWTVAEGSLGDPPDTLPDLAGLEEAAVSASLPLEVQRAKIDAADRTIGVTRIESFLPHLGVGAVAKQEGDGWAFGPLVSLSVPIWSWGQGERSVATAKLRRAELRRDEAAIEVRAAARALSAQLVAAHGRAVRMKARILPLRQRIADESVLEYNAMTLDAFDLLTIRREQIAAEVRHVEARLAYFIAATKIDELRAGALPEGWGATTGAREATEMENERDH
jgi:cobalt-zinc-cadmium efflux system outer membrane protein